MALELGGYVLGTFNCLLEEREQPEPLPGKGSFTEEKNLFCMHAEREQAQPQLYGTSYLLVKIALTDHKVEFAFLLQAEHDDMLEIWDQSQSIQLDYQDRRRRIQRPHHTADYFLFRYGQSGWVECKTTQELIRQAQTRPNRY